MNLTSDPLKDTRALKAAWNAARFVTWKQFIKYFEPASTNYSPQVIAQIDRIWEHMDINAMIETRLAAMKRGDHMEASRIRGELLAQGVELHDKTSDISKSVSTTWEVKR
ncbi:MAG: hypothetical protein FJX29_03315 [Alphaproteobacteria bacterium]|nr:hypothetical protein [Alphaproteobacteria bacterium]